MKEPRILTGLAVQIGEVTLRAVIDDATGTVRIEQAGTGEDINDVRIARSALAGRVNRTRPDLKLIEETPAGQQAAGV